MAVLTAANLEPAKAPRIRVTWSLNPLPGLIVLVVAFLGQVSVLSEDYAVRLGAVLVVLAVAFVGGMRFGRAEQARELLLGRP